MSFEELDKKVREAADQHHPAYDEKAWNKMEKLLNKHLPQKKDDKRRFLFLLFLFLLTGGGIAVFISQPWKPGNSIASANKENTTTTKPVSNSSTPGNPANKTGELNTLKEEVNMDVPLSVKTKEQFQSDDPVSTAIVYPGRTDNKPLSVRKDFTLKSGENTEAADKINPQGIKQEEKDNLRNNSLPDLQGQNVNPVVQNNNFQKMDDKKSIVPDKDGQTAVNPQAIADVKTPKAASTKKNKKHNAFFFSLSAGPDVSAAKWSNPGKVKLVGGGGVGYTIKDRFTLRTGFYTGRKIYTASPDEYYPPSSFWTYYPNLDRVDANCKVYEIPLYLSYHFGSSAKKNWFAGGGISSYLMKTETYTYFYKDQAGQPASRKWSIKDQNNHYFSVITLSGGYERKLNKRFSVMAEPYVKIPLTGVGYGKVELNSAGILLSATIKPFGKN
jgi:hypothetical protein